MRLPRSARRAPLLAVLALTACGSGGGAAGPHEAFRVACLDRLNSLRATVAMPPLARWKAAEACVDQQATADEASGHPHEAWIGGTYPCNGSGQNECLGYGEAGIVACLEAMWAERDQPGCSGCDACAAGDAAACASCPFSGVTTCGHYVNMRSPAFTQVACGMSAAGGWSAINFR